MNDLFEVKTDSNGNSYIEVSGPLTPIDEKDVRIALIPANEDSNNGRALIRIYNWSCKNGEGRTGVGNVDIPLDVIPAFKEAINHLLIKSSNKLG